MKKIFDRIKDWRKVGENKIKTIKEKIKAKMDSRMEEKWKKNVKKQERFLKKINIKMPFLFTTFYKGKQKKSLDSLERIRVYNEIKLFKSQRINNFVIPLLTAIIIILAIFQIILQVQNSVSPTPNINLEIIDKDANKFFSNTELVQLNHNETWNFLVSLFGIEFIVRNDGRGNTGNIHLYL